MPVTYCTNKDMAVMQAQQQKPMIIGFPPFLIKFTKFVFNPIAHIAIAIKNFASHFIAGIKLPIYRVVNPLSGIIPIMVVSTAAAIKYKIKNGNTLLNENEVPSPPFFLD